MAPATHFSHLSGPRQALLRLFQAVNFGYVEGLEIRGGEPVFSPPPVVFVELKLDADDSPRQEASLAEFAVRAEVVRLMDALERLGDGTVERIDIRYGIPRRVLIERGLPEVTR
ncbi:MAG: hypothetical protein FJW34_26545 [Acidobacteria bacterium]|nr:hypothetical protein [Acidobacteriota bacterium]